MSSKLVNITRCDRKNLYQLGKVNEGDLFEQNYYATRTCRLFQHEIDFIEKTEKDFNKVQKILKNNYEEWEKNLSKF